MPCNYKFLLLVLTSRLQTRRTYTNWAAFATPCLLYHDHNWDQRQRSISLPDAANRWNIPFYGFSFFRVSFEQKKRNIFSPIITRLNIYHRWLIKLLRYSTSLKFRCVVSRSHFPAWSKSLQLVSQIFSSSITGHFH